MKKRKIFWIYLIFISLLYISLFFFIKSKIDISGSFSVNPPEKKIYLTDLPEVMRLKLNEPFLLDIDYKLGYGFASNTDLLKINKDTGEISFTPANAGEYPVIISAFKDINDYEIKLVRFVVE